MRSSGLQPFLEKGVGCRTRFSFRGFTIHTLTLWITVAQRTWLYFKYVTSKECLEISSWSVSPVAGTVRFWVVLCPEFSLFPCLSIWETMPRQLESPGLRPFQSLHCSFLCTPADSFLNGSTVSSPRYSTDDSFWRGMKKICQPWSHLHQYLQSINRPP